MGIKSDLEESFDFDIVDEFLDHFSLMVDSMEIMVLDLSKDEMYKRAVDELFRVFHNIKSASGYLKLTSINKLAAFVEDVLETLRKQEEHANQETIDWLLQISDMFSTWNEDFNQDRELSKIKFSLLKLPDLDAK
jgi:two-component system chemotaxis sensor kinase CheA